MPVRYGAEYWAVYAQNTNVPPINGTFMQRATHNELIIREQTGSNISIIQQAKIKRIPFDDKYAREKRLFPEKTSRGACGRPEPGRVSNSAQACSFLLGLRCFGTAGWGWPLAHPGQQRKQGLVPFSPQPPRIPHQLRRSLVGNFSGA
ncbi:MAG: hypothetical protein CSA33_08400 [Desulfobulbus propionicus]|nr:MAG: hypothetical protein CSA33_08400 [Desulfobulbus propionicus]